ncbi:MAG: twin-arginine translocase subunit TatC [Alphaproteobacteria bacterium]|nr:twin-arginine translocase subunit TatC [Alphaproteobacteria bacterium]
MDPLEAQPLLAHFIDLRRRLIYSLLAVFAAFVACYFFAPEIYAFLVRPLAKATGDESRRLIYTGLTEAFITYIKLALWAGCFLAFPVIAAQIWLFVAPGLYKNERHAFLPFLIASPVLFLMGAALAYYFVFPLAWQFFLSFEVPAAPGSLPIQLEARVSEYLSLSMTIIFAFGLAFQLPVVLVLLTRIGLLSAAKLSQFRRYAIVIIFVVAAVITPPDVISQISLAVPMMLLYEASILAARWMEKQGSGIGGQGPEQSFSTTDPRSPTP